MWLDELRTLAVQFGDDAVMCALVAYLLVQVLKWLYWRNGGAND